MMRGLFRWVGILILGLVGGILALGWWVIPSEIFWKIALARSLRPYDIMVESVRFDQWHYRKYPRGFLANAQIQGRWRNVLWKIHAAQLQFQWEEGLSSVLFVQDLTLHTNDLHCDKGALRFEKSEGGIWQAGWSSGRCETHGLVLTEILMNVHQTPQELVISDFRGRFYGGQLAGNFKRERKEPFAYRMEARIEDVHLNQMEAIYPAIFEQVSGVLRGRIQIDGVGTLVSEVDGYFDVPKDAAVRAFLLKNLMEYLPARSQKLEFDKLVAINGMVPLDRAVARIQSIDDQKLRLGIDLESQKYNVKPQVTVDINFDGRYQDLLLLLKSYSSKESGYVQ